MQNLTNEQMAALYRQTKDKAYAVALYALKNPHDAEDVAQDAYVTAFRNIAQLSDIAKFEPWLMRIVANRAKDVLKKKKPDLFSAYADPETGEEEFIPTLPDETPDADVQRTVENDERRQILLDMLETLREDEKLCVLMFYEERMHISEIAETLGVEEYTVKNYLAAAKRKLRKQIEEKEKQGYTLRGISGLSVALALRWLFTTPAGQVSLRNGAAAAVPAGAAAAPGTAAVAAAGSAAAGITGSLVAKITAAVCAFVLLGTGGAVAWKKLSGEKKNRSPHTAVVTEAEPDNISAAEPADAQTDPDSRNLEANAEDLEKLGTEFDLGSFLTALTYTFAEWSADDFRVDFDAARDAEQAPGRYILRYPYSFLYAFFYGAPQEATVDLAEYYFYFRYPLRDLEWLATHVLNSGNVAPDAFVPPENRPYDYGALEGDEIRIYSSGASFKEYMLSKIRNTERLSDGSYLFEVEYALQSGVSPVPMDRTGVLRAALREDDGIRYWSVLSYHAEASDPAADVQAPDAAPDSAGTPNNTYYYVDLTGENAGGYMDMREGPSADSALVTRIHDDSLVRILDDTILDGWVYVCYELHDGDFYGYVPYGFLQSAGGGSADS